MKCTIVTNHEISIRIIETVFVHVVNLSAGGKEMAERTLGEEDVFRHAS